MCCVSRKVKPAQLCFFIGLASIRCTLDVHSIGDPLLRACRLSSADERAVVIKMFREETVSAKKSENAVDEAVIGSIVCAILGAILSGLRGLAGLRGLVGWLLGGDSDSKNEKGERRRSGAAGSVCGGALNGASPRHATTLFTHSLFCFLPDDLTRPDTLVSLSSSDLCVWIHSGASNVNIIN